MDLYEELRRCRDEGDRLVAGEASTLAGLHPEQKVGADNLLRYLALRRRDLRPLQGALHRSGLSSLGRCEPYVDASLAAVLGVLARLEGRPAPPPAALGFDEGGVRLVAQTRALFGARPHRRVAHVMVTLDDDAHSDPDLLRDLLAAGMTVMRINGAHGDPGSWTHLVQALRDLDPDASCRVEIDLPGPNPRTVWVDDQPRGAVVKGDALVLEPNARFALVRDPARPLDIPRFGVTLPAVLDNLAVGHAVHLDDGEISGTVVEVRGDGDSAAYVVEVTRAKKGAGKVRGAKGVNLPDTPIALPSVGADDMVVLDWAAAHADLVALSFVRSPDDVRGLYDALDARGAHDLGVVLKIETRDGFERLPRLLLEAMRRPRIGVMVARGDLGVELGFERMAEVQEEILWLCEAAHVPVIWATQVLESLTKKGVPARAEVTDAAMAARAECVMLNKGQHVASAVRFLHDVLQRMEGHQDKKRSMLRPLHVASLR